MSTKFKGGEIVRVKLSCPKSSMPSRHGHVELHGKKGKIHVFDGEVVRSNTGLVLVKFPAPRDGLHNGDGTLPRRQGWFISEEHLEEVE